MSMLRNVLTYMGLGPDEDYDDGYLYESADDEIDLTEDEQAIGDLGVDDDYSNGADPFGGPEDADQAVGGVLDEDPHAQRDRPDWLESSTTDPSGRRRISIDDDGGAAPEAKPGRHDLHPPGEARSLRAVETDVGRPGGDADGIRVRSLDDDPIAEVGVVKPKAIAPRSFSDAKILADEFKADVPIILNLRDVERDLARRLIDFASGICYAMDGSMEKIAPQVFLLTPQDVEVSDEERRRIGQRGYDR